jgi:YHS domain-containing protein
MFRVLLDFLSYVALFLFLRALLRAFLSSRRPVRPARPAPRPDSVQSAGELKKDPVCGTYVSVAASFTRTVHGEVLHFCSRECRDRYAAP